MKILMVTPYPPMRDGIGAYAVQEVARLRAEGHDVEVLSPGPSAAHHHLDLATQRGPVALAKRVRGYDKVIIQFQPDIFYPQPYHDRLWARFSYAMGLAFRLARDLEVRAHEVDYSKGRGDDRLGRAVRFMWHSAASVVVHTESQRQAFHDAFHYPRERIRVVDHGAHFVHRTRLDRSGARGSLDLPEPEFMFLCIGFIQRSKGFDRAIRAFRSQGLGARGCRLDIVGSVRLGDVENLEHLDHLRALAASTPGVTIHDRYVTDEEFDRWLVASDLVLLPYRNIWSSGVLERAALYDRPVIITRVGGLADQAREDTVVVSGDAELAAAMRQAAGRAVAEGAGEEPSPSGGSAWFADQEVTREVVMAEIRTRAAARRSPPPAAEDGPATASLPLRRLAPLDMPRPVSGRPGVTSVKRLLQRLTAWQLEPVVRHVNSLQDAALRTAEALAQQQPAQGGAPGSAGYAGSAAAGSVGSVGASGSSSSEQELMQ